jgi:hypothetical protein
MTESFLAATPTETCWCGRIPVRPTQRLIDAGLTRSCGKWYCQPPPGVAIRTRRPKP